MGNRDAEDIQEITFELRTQRFARKAPVSLSVLEVRLKFRL